MTQPTQQQIREFGLEQHIYNGETHWVTPNASPEWNEVGSIADFVMFVVYNTMPERSWLALATGDAGATAGFGLFFSLVGVCLLLGGAVLVQRLYSRFQRYAAKKWGNDPEIISVYRASKPAKRGATPRADSARRKAKANARLSH